MDFLPFPNDIPYRNMRDDKYSVSSFDQISRVENSNFNLVSENFSRSTNNLTKPKKEEKF